MTFKKLSLIFTLLFLFIFPLQVNASITVNTFQITIDGSQQKDAMIYGNLVAYTNFGGTQGIDIWGYDLPTQQNFPLLEKPGDQFLTGFYGDLLVYEDVDSSQNYDVRIYNLKTHDDKLIAGGTGAQTSGVTNGNVVAYINGGACGELHLFNLESQIDNVIFNNTCHPVRISENKIVFPAPDPNGTNVKGYNLESGQLFDISIANNFQESANVYKNKVVWVHYITGALGDYNAIVLKDLTSGVEKTIYESSTSTLQSPSVSDKYVVWSESSTQHVNGIKGYNLETGEVFEVQPQGSHQNSHTTPSIWDNKAVWMSWRTGNGDIYGSTFQTLIPQPTITLTNPINNSQILFGTEVNIEATASSSAGVNRVVFHVDGIHQCTDYSAPHTCTWDVPQNPGATYKLTAWVIDNNGQKNSSSVNITSTAPLSCLQSPSGILSWWTGDGNTNDLIGPNNGIALNGASFAQGMVNQAFNFDGVDDLIQASANNLPTGSSDRTLEMWVKINQFLDNSPNPHSTLEAFFAGYGAFGSYNQTYQMGTAGNVSYFSQWGDAVFGPSLLTNKWYHVATTNTGNSVNLYLDGINVGSGTLGIDTPANSNFYIGRVLGNLGDIRRLNGLVDEVTIYNRALSASEINSIFDADSNGKCK